MQLHKKKVLTCKTEAGGILHTTLLFKQKCTLKARMMKQ